MTPSPDKTTQVACAQPPDPLQQAETIRTDGGASTAQWEEMARAEIAKADASLGSEPWAVRALLERIDAMAALVASLTTANENLRTLAQENLAIADEHQAARVKAETDRENLTASLNAATDLLIRANKLIPGLTATYIPIVLGDTAEARNRASAAEERCRALTAGLERIVKMWRTGYSSTELCNVASETLAAAAGSTTAEPAACECGHMASQHFMPSPGQQGCGATIYDEEVAQPCRCSQFVAAGSSAEPRENETQP